MPAYVYDLALGLFILLDLLEGSTDDDWDAQLVHLL